MEIKSAYPDYRLLDPRVNAARAPYTFFLPTQTQLDAIKPGDMVKLMFEYGPDWQLCHVERMWVTVEAVNGSVLLARLSNHPQEPTAELKISQMVQFRRHHVISIGRDNAGRYPQDQPRREYHDGCVVDECVLDGSVPVGYIHREPPYMHHKGDEYPDSGWRICGRTGGASDEEIAHRKSHYVALGPVLNQDDSWLHLIDTPIGAAFERDFERDVWFSIQEEA